MENKPRLRAPNFTSSDSLLLCDIISKHKQFIENKKTDGVNLLQKQKAWAEVTKEFNSCTTGFSRTVESLQQNYKNLKKKAKKSEIKTHMGTGGGPPPSSSGNAHNILLDKVKILVRSGLDDPYTVYDGDSSLASQNTAPIESRCMDLGDDSETLKDDKSSLQINPNLLMTCDYSSQESTGETQNDGTKTHLFRNLRANLKRKRNHLLTCKKKQSVNDRFRSLASAKMDLVELQKELLRIQIIEEKEKLEHNRVLRFMEIEDTKRKYKHLDKIRNIELEQLNKK